MYRVEEVSVLADRVFSLWVLAPHVARHAKAGQFVILRLHERGERIPLTISAVRGESIRLIFMVVGKTTWELSTLRAGGQIRDIVGPLGIPSEAGTIGTCVIVGGGAGIAGTPILAQTLKKAGNYVIGILGARSAGLLILEDEMREWCDEVLIATDDGTKGRKGFAADVLREVLQRRRIDRAWIIGPAIMMKVTSDVTKPYGVKTWVSLNPIMVDGTGMCGSCRVIVDGVTSFACVDGPEFDAHRVDFDSLRSRQQAYLAEERISLEKYQKDCTCTGEKRHG
jgi:ferredoxin--NADP+ reductase